MPNRMATATEMATAAARTDTKRPSRYETALRAGVSARPTWWNRHHGRRCWRGLLLCAATKSRPSAFILLGTVRLEKQTITSASCASPKRKPPFGWIGSRIELFRKISGWASKGRVDLVEVPDYQGFAAYWKPLPVPVVARLHGSLTYFSTEWSSQSGYPNAWNVPLYAASTSLLLFASTRRAEPKDSSQRSHVPAQILYNPVEFSGQIDAATARQRHRVVFSGTLTPKKGIVSLIKAWPAVALFRARRRSLHVFGKDGRGPNGGSMQEFLGATPGG